LDWTQEQLAERCGMTMQHVQQLEDPHKANPTLKTLAKLSRGLKIDPVDLLTKQAEIKN
jgi:transcriptional regulator with XRE-family HTH domain